MNRIKLLAAAILCYMGVCAENIKVACVGNSITEGMKIENPAENAYPAQLGRLLGDGYTVGNFGKSGATLLRKGHMPYNEQPQYAAALEFAPDIVLIHLGVNDTDPRNWPNHDDEFISDYIELINSFKQINPDVRIIIARLSPIGAAHKRFKTGTRDWRDQINSAIDDIAAITGVELIDFAPPLVDRSNLIPDTLHPTIEGAGLLAETAAKAITGNYGGLQLPEIYQDGMVLQRNKPLTINGTADAGEKVTVKIGKQTASTVTDNRGNWSLTLTPLKATDSTKLTISTPAKSLTFSDVAVGEVWLASGQSNMEFQLRRSTTFAEDTIAAADPRLRLFNMRPGAHTDAIPWTDEQKDSVDRLLHFRPARWEKANAENAADFSAVAWNFGRMLRDSLNVPVGIICNAVGGSGIESWIDPETLEHNVPDIFIDWRNNDYLQPWVRGRITQNCGKEGSHRHPYEPSYLFSAGIRPLGAFPIAGVIWYQGESNAHNVELHEQLFRLFIESWRNNWHDASLPVLTTQLSSLERPSWPSFRDSQRRLALEIPGVEMAVSSDRGTHGDVHPRDKRPIGQRLGLLALNRVYGHDVTAEGPVAVSASLTAPGEVTLKMQNADGMTPTPTTFEVAEFDRYFFPADATVHGDEIIVKSDAISNPKFVRYGWQPYTEANLTNAQGLPASTFKIKVQ